MSENWHTWYLGRADFESGVRFSKFQPQNPFLGKFGPKKHSLIGDPLLFLGIKLVLVLYFKIASHSSDAFHMRF